MLHTNCGELALLFDTFCRIWRAGGQATLTTSTKDGQVQANLELQLGLPAAARAGAPPHEQRLSSPSSVPGHPGASRCKPCHRGPSAKAKSRARAALHQAAKKASASEGASPSSRLVTSADLPEEVSSPHSDGASPSPPAEPTPVSGGALPIASTVPVEATDSTVPVEATPPLPSPVKASSPTSGDVCAPALGDASPDPGGDLPSASGGKTTPSPGDASNFLTAPYFYQCTAKLPRAEPCEKIFCNMEDLETHCRSVHGVSAFNYCQHLHIDSHKNLYIL